MEQYNGMNDGNINISDISKYQRYIQIYKDMYSLYIACITFY